MTSPEPVAIMSMVNIMRIMTPPPLPRATWAMYGVTIPVDNVGEEKGFFLRWKGWCSNTRSKCS